MIYTNRHNWPIEIANAIIRRSRQYSRGEADFSVTDLLLSPQQYYLRERHYDEIEIDVSTLLQTWQGSLIHDAIEMNVPKVTVLMGAYFISGKADYILAGVIKDYKRTRCNALLYGSHLDKWTMQLNTYRYLYLTSMGISTQKLYTNAILWDWNLYAPKFPSAVETKQIDLWSPDYTKQQIERAMDRLSIMSKELPPCTDSERWAKADSWAVLKKGGKRALKLYPTEGQACGDAEQREYDTRVEFRVGDATHFCRMFCICRDVCPQYKALKGEELQDVSN